MKKSLKESIKYIINNLDSENAKSEVIKQFRDDIISGLEQERVARDSKEWQEGLEALEYLNSL